MIVSTKGRYALRVMIDLSEHQSEKYVPLKEIAARQEISEKYLENILKVLVQNGLTGALFLHSSRQNVQFFLSRITVDGLGLLRYTLPLMCPFTLLIEERGTLLRNIFFSLRAFLRFVFWARSFM